VRLAGTDWAGSPARHEAGTPNVVGAVTLAAACWQVASLPAGAVAAHEGALLRRLSGGLEGIGGVRPLRLWPDEADRIGVVSFTVDGWPAALVAQYLSAEHGIGVRDGRFCAHPLLARLNPAGTAVRASLGLGSRADDVDRLITALTALADHGPAWTYAGAEQDYVPLPDPRAPPGWLTAAADSPVIALSSEITTGMSAPPMGSVIAIPRSSAKPKNADTTGGSA